MKAILPLLVAALIIISSVSEVAAAQSAGSDTNPLASNANWCWFSEPKALHYSGVHDRTYFGYVTNAGAIKVGQYRPPDKYAADVYTQHVRA